MKYTTRELTKEEGEALTKDMQAVLEKHGAEMGVTASISLLKRVETPEGANPTVVGGIPSPKEFLINDGENPETQTQA